MLTFLTRSSKYTTTRIPLIFNSQILLSRFLPCHHSGDFSHFEFFTGITLPEFHLPMALHVNRQGFNLTYFWLHEIFFAHFLNKFCHLILQLNTMILHLPNSQWDTVTNEMGRNNIHQGGMLEWELILHVDSSLENILILWWLLFPPPCSLYNGKTFYNEYSDTKSTPIWKSSQKCFCPQETEKFLEMRSTSQIHILTHSTI